jgi:hypothetical protein
MTSHCARADAFARYQDDAGWHLLSRMDANFSEELISQPDSTATGPFFPDKNGAAQDAADGQARPH